MTPEQHADSIMSLIESDFGQSGYDVQWMVIRDQIQQIQQENYEEAAKICEGNHLVSGSIGPLMNAGWAAANKADAQAIRQLKDKLGG